MSAAVLGPPGKPARPGRCRAWTFDEEKAWFAWKLLEVGARCIIGTHWPVADRASRVLMSELYGLLLATGRGLQGNQKGVLLPIPLKLPSTGLPAGNDLLVRSPALACGTRRVFQRLHRDEVRARTMTHPCDAMPC
jgi:hypothetical protein